MLSCSLSRRLLEALEPRTLLSTLPNDYTPDLWHLHNTGQTLSAAVSGPATGTPGADIAADKAWDLTTGSRNVVIAILDTGIDLTHPDLAANIWTNPADGTHGYNFVDNNTNVQDTDGHGTAVAGVIGAVGNNGVGITGVAWKVSLLPIKVSQNNVTLDANVIAGINYVIGLKQAGVNIVAINASYVSTSVASLDQINAIQRATDAGMLYINAAGNGGINLDALLGPLASAYYASIPNLITVAASNNQDQLWSLSDYGATTVDLAAPRVDITTTWNNALARYLPLTGTSFAAPMVSGTAALMAALNPSATADQLRAAILSGVDVLPQLAGKVATGGRLDAYKALQAIAPNAVPTGWIDTLNASVVSGWAFDADAGAASIPVHVWVDGHFYTAGNANGYRADLTSVVGSPLHGFTLPLNLPVGDHTVQVYFIDEPSGAGHLFGTFQVSNHAPIGHIDVANGTAIAGWAGDTDAPATAATVRVDIDGQQGTPFAAGASRADLGTVFAGNTNHAFAYALPAGLAMGIHRADVYVYDAPTNAATLLTSVTFSTNSPPIGWVDAITSAGVSGWAFDANAGAGAVQVQLTIDGTARPLVTANLSRPDLTAVVGSANHGFAIALPALAAGSHTVSVAAVDPNTLALVPLRSATLVTALPHPDTPTGWIDSFTASAVTGWTLDPANPGASTQVRVDVDGVAGTPVTASIPRYDLVGTYGSANHGFVATVLALGAGTHVVDVYFLNPVTGTPTLVASRLFGTAAPTGFVDAMSTTAVSGWAQSPNNPAASIYVRLEVDDLPGPVVLAAISRPDLVAAIGSGNHGFSIAVPRVSPGVHTLTLRALDPYTLVATVLGQATLTF